MQEIEAKILEIDKKKLLQKLRKLKARKIGEYEVRSVFFDTPKEKLHKNDQVLRLRQKGKILLTFKQRNKKNRALAKHSKEIEIEVSEFEKTKEIIESIGFRTRESHPKHRTSYKLGKALVEIDEYRIIPPLVEIEAPSEKEILKVAKKLGFGKSDLSSLGGFELLKKYNKPRWIK